LLPTDFPPFSTVQKYFYRWRDEGTLRALNNTLVMAALELTGKQSSPTAGVIDRSHGVDDGQRFLQNEWSFQQPLCSEVPMFKTEKSATAIQINLAAIFVSMELSRSTWLITTLLPGNGEKMSKYSIA